MQVSDAIANGTVTSMNMGILFGVTFEPYIFTMTIASM